MNFPIDSLRDRIQQFLVTTTDPEAREDIFEVLDIMLVIVDEVRRVESANTKTAQDLSQHLNE